MIHQKNEISNGVKVLIPALHYYPVVGGIETWTKNIAEKLSEKAEVFVVTGKVRNQPLKEILNGVKIWRTSFFALANLSASPLIYTLSLLPCIFLKSLFLIKKEKINLIHCQGFLSSFLGFWLSKIAGIPYLVTVQRMERKGNWLKEMVYKKAFVCIGASRSIEEYFREIGCKNIKVIPNGIDLKKFDNLDRQKSRQKLGLRDEFTIMTVARLERVKGVDYLIEAMTKGGLPEIHCLLLIIGDGSERKNLEKLVEKLNLKEKVKFLGQIPNEKIPEYLAGADCFVLPSRREGFGIALLEARAAGLPVIGADVGGIHDIVTDQFNGILIRKNQDPESISNAIYWVYNPANKQNVMNLVDRSKEELKNYDWQNIALKVFKIYENCLGNANLSS